MYPVTIVPDRYNGFYSSAKWLAFHLGPYDVANSSAEDSDIECSDFWSSRHSERVGRGNTPNEAYEDLVRRMGITYV